jgi:hypothetical protein
MAKRQATFRQSDLKRALSAASAAGLFVERVEIDSASGRFALIIAKGPAEAAPPGDPLDNWLAENARSSEGH